MPVTVAESTRKPGTAKSKGTADTSQRLKTSNAFIIVLALCESRYHTCNDYRHKDLSVIKAVWMPDEYGI